MARTHIFLAALLLFSVFARVCPARGEGWTSDLAGKIDIEILEPAPTSAASPMPVVFYLRNLAAPRVGTETDATLIEELRAAGNLVAVIDYAAHPHARVPWINADLARLRDDVRAKKLLADRTIDAAHVFIVPAGSRLTRDVIFYREPSRTWAMDIIAPAAPARPVGTVLEFSCDNQNRMGNTSLSICNDTLLDAAATEGHAIAMADHPVPAPYKGLDPMPDSAWKIKAAVRTLRAQGARLSLNGRIVPVGFSRGSGMALMLVTTEGMPEFEKRGEHTDTSGAVQGAVVLSGRFTYLDLRADDPMLPRYAQAWGDREAQLATWRRQGALDYLEKAPAVPLFLSINVSESPHALHQMAVLRRRLDELGGKFIYVPETDPRGHKVPADREVLGSLFRYLAERLQAPSPL